MPFTFSHPAIVLPVSKLKWLRVSLTGLIAGSIVPDMEFILRLQETNNFAHDWPWVLLFNIPFAAALTFLYHFLIRDVLIDNAPEWFRLRLIVFTQFNWSDYFKRHIIGVVVSVTAGIASHIFLDAMTHNKGALTKLSPFFYYNVYFGAHKVPVYDILQYSLSLAGAVYMLWFVSRLKPGVAHPAESKKQFWLLAALLCTIIMAIRFIAYHTGQSWEDIIIAIVGSVVYGIIGASVLLHFFSNKKSPA